LTRRLALIAPLLFGLALAGPARAQGEEPLVADLSKHLIAITTGFTGTDVLLFGATDGPGDVVVVVRGPEKEETVRRKENVAGLWINRARMGFRDLPQFYHIAATKPLADLKAGPELQRHQIGLDVLKIEPEAESLTLGDYANFREALIRLKQVRGVFGAEVAPVHVLGNRLFRTEVHFPANVPVGIYRVEVYLIREGQVASAQMTPLSISKTGFGADLYDFAHHHGALYGLLAILISVLSGWLASVAFKKR
jgi:uncharacterized protein (TIGR02186 family)